MNNTNNKCYVIALTEIYLLYWFGAAGMAQWFIGDSIRPLPPQTSLGSVPWLESMWRLIYIVYVVHAGFISPITSSCLLVINRLTRQSSIVWSKINYIELKIVYLVILRPKLQHRKGGMLTAHIAYIKRMYTVTVERVQKTKTPRSCSNS